MKKNILYINEVLKKKSNLNDQKKFDSNEIALILSSNLNLVMNHWIKFQQEWININYKKFKDHDKYILLIYLISKSWENNSSLFKFHSIDDYHSKIEIDLADISLLKIVEDLKIPKETIRRKLIELEKENIIKRKGQKITLFKLALSLQKPENSIKTLSIFFEKLSIILSAHDWFGPSISRKDVELYFKKFYTIFWHRYLKMQIPFLIRWKKIFGDLESWVIWANMGMNQNLNLEKNIKKIEAKKNVNLFQNNKANQYIEDIINMSDTQANEPMRGVNASSIADVSFIPRATVIRKLNKLSKENIIKRNKKLEYFLTSQGKLNMKIKDNYLINQKSIALFVTDIFNLIKKSSFKI
jgi:DNA-binding Lrp family transcriptional regulator